MKTTNNQTESSEPIKTPRSAFFKPDRHYVSVQAPGGDWDGDQLDRLLDTIDPKTGEPAYRIEARGDTEDGRRITGDRRKVILSCSLDYIDRVNKENSNASIEQAKMVNKGQTNMTRSVDGRVVRTVEDESFGLTSGSNALPAGIIG